MKKICSEKQLEGKSQKLNLKKTTTKKLNIFGEREADRQTDRDRDKDRERANSNSNSNSNSKTLFYKDCSLGSVKYLSNN